MNNISEYARICKDTYITGENITTYNIVNTIYNENSEFDARIYQQNNEIVICYAASQDFFDGVNNIQILLGLLGLDSSISIPSQLQDALNLYYETKQYYQNLGQNVQITLTGHSFGGVLAQLTSYITGAECISFSTPGLEYATNILTLQYIMNHYRDIVQEYNLTSSDFVCSDSNITDYSNMNDPVGNIGKRVGEQYLLEPNPIRQNENSMVSPHQDIDIFFDEQNINNARQISSWNIKYAGALFLYDTNYSGYNVQHQFIQNHYSIDENDLKTAIDIIRREIGEPTNYLSYTTENGMYILDSKESSHVINGSDSNSSNQGNDVIFGNSGSDIINGYSGSDILIGGEGNDTLNGGDNNDTLIAGDTNLSIETLQKLLNHKSQITTVSQYESKNGGTNTLNGGSGNDLLIGDKGTDYLHGDENDDYIIGGKGNDYLYGGSGYDTYVIKSGDGVDVISDIDGTGCIKYNNKVLTGAHNEDPNATTWYDGKVIYNWSGINGTTLIINNSTTVLNFTNGDLDINLTRGEEQEDNNPYPEVIPYPENPNLPDYVNNAEGSDGELREPIVFDLNNDGINITNINNGRYFDHDNDGFKEASAWIEEQDGLLVTDLNNNGKIENGTELVTGLTLAQYDTNNDGKIDINDTNINNLKILKGDGTVQSLQEAGISSINLNTQRTRRWYEDGSEMFEVGSYTTTDGRTLEYGEFNFAINQYNAIEINKVEVSNDVKVLPYIQNYGKAHSLWQAIMLDETNTLKNLVQSFVNETNDDTRMNLVDQILEQWAGANNVVEGSRGEYINAKHLAVLETFSGKEFLSQHEGETNPSNPNIEAAGYLNTAYEKLKVHIYAQLMAKSHLSSLFNQLQLVPNEKEELKFDLSNVVTTLQSEMLVDEAGTKQKIYEFAKVLKGFGFDTKSNFFDPKDEDCFYTTFTKNDRNLKWQIDTIGKVVFNDDTCEGLGTQGDDAQWIKDHEPGLHSLDGDDVLYGNYFNNGFAACNGDDILDGGDGDDEGMSGFGGNDILWGGNGNDKLYGSSDDDILFGDNGDDYLYPDHTDNSDPNPQEGNDIVIGGKGNDTIISVSGNDTFIFNLGDGNDTIYEHQGIDTLFFGKNISWSDLTFTQNNNDMVIAIQNTNDSITVKDWFVENTQGVLNYDNHKIEKFEFANGDKHSFTEIQLETNSSDTVVYNSNGYVETVENYNSQVNLQQYWNQVRIGDNSTNTIVLTQENTDVHIENSSSDDKLVLNNENITLSKTFFNLDEYGLNIDFEDFMGHITVSTYNEGKFDDDILSTFEFYDGTIITDLTPYLERTISYTDYVMGERLQELRLLGNNNLTVTGSTGDNRIYSNSGNSTIEAGQGNDYIESIYGGSDTYIYNLGDGFDRIRDLGGNDTLQFGDGITSNMLLWSKDLRNNDLKIEVDGQIITIENYFNSNANKIENFVFADETVITDVSSLISTIDTEPNQDVVMNSTLQGINIWGSNHVNVTGNSLDNSIRTSENDSTINAGIGNDNMYNNSYSNERYIYNLGDGNDTIYDEGGIDAILFGTGITQSMISMAQDENNNDLIISITTQNNENDGEIRLRDYFFNTDNRIEMIKFADGTIIDNFEPLYDENCTDSTYLGSVIASDNQTTIDVSNQNNAKYILGNALDNTITGNSGNNTYASSFGNDTITDILGDDTYLFMPSSGHDTITDLAGNDTVKFAFNPDVNEINFERDDNNLTITYLNRAGSPSLTILNYFLDDTYKIENFDFGGGTVLNTSDILDRLSNISPSTDYVMTENDNNVVRMAGTGNISVTSNNQNNTIYGNSGNNTFISQGGVDTLTDLKGGNDTYIFNSGNSLNITDYQGSDTISFVQGITLNNIVFRNAGNDLELYFKNGINGNITINNYYLNNDYKIENFVFADNSSLTDISQYVNSIAQAGNIIMQTGLYGASLRGDGDFSVTGNASDNYIEGNMGNNTFTGGLGDDEFYDEAYSNDTYIYNLGDGNDTIRDFGGYDVIKFRNGITKNNIKLIRNENDLLINFKDNNGHTISGSIRVNNYFSWEYGDTRIEELLFADGTSINNIDEKVTKLITENDAYVNWNCHEIELTGNNNLSVNGSYENDLIYGNSGNNIYNLYSGNDTVIDTQGGDDTYIFNNECDTNSILDIGGNDTMRLGFDINSIKFIRGGNDLHLYSRQLESDVIKITDYFLDNNHKIERFEFNDSDVITDVTDYISGQASYGNITMNENDTSAYLLGSNNSTVTINNQNYKEIYGNSGNNTYILGSGDGRIQDKLGGDDTYIYNLGSGNISIGDIRGNDTIRFGEGITLSNVEFERIYNNLKVNINVSDTLGNIWIENYYHSDLRRIENFVFSDNTLINDLTPYLVSITSNENIVLSNGIRNVTLLGNDNISATGNSLDNNIIGNSGNNTIEGGLGNDSCYDDAGGDDTYIYNLGDGNDFINDFGGYDTIRFGSGITPSMISMENEGGGVLKICINAPNSQDNGYIRICNQLFNDNWKIEKIVFADNTEVTDFSQFYNFIETSNNYTYAAGDTRDLYVVGNNDVTIVGNSLNNFIGGNSGDNTYQGNGGNDTIFSGTGDDTYIYNLGDGNDYILDVGGYDSIQFGQGLNASDLQVSAWDNGNMEISFNGVNGSIVIEGQLSSSDNVIEQLEFYDGTIITNLNSYINNTNGNEAQMQMSSHMLNDGSNYDVNMLIQEMNSYGVYDDIILTDTQMQNNEELMLAMVS